MLRLPKVLLEVLWFAPIIMVACVGASMPGSITAAIAWQALAAVMGGLAGILPQRARFYASIAGAIAWLAAFAFLGPRMALMAQIILSASGLICSLITARQTHKDVVEAFPNSRWIAGICLYVVSWVILFFMGDVQVRGIVGWVAIGYILTMIFIINRSSVRAASYQNAALPSGLMAGNRWLVIVLALVMVILINIPTLMRWAGTAFAAVVSGIGWLIDKFISLGLPSDGEGGGGGGDPFDMSELIGETPEPSLFARIMEIIFMGVAVVLALAAAVGIVFVLIRLWRKIWARLQSAMSTYRKGFSDGYIDEVTSLQDEDASRSLGDRLRQRLREILAPPIRWESLDNRQRVRFAFAGVIKNARKRGQAVDASTPAEMLTKRQITAKDGDLTMLVESYERARYSRHEISDQAAQNAKKTVRR